MATQLIMTVGTNALPVWVAWYHLKDQLADPIEVRFIYTNDTISEKNLLVTHCHPASFGNHIQTSPGNPQTVRTDVGRVLNPPIQFTDLHVHYTGGTKVMSVETVAALEYGLLNNHIVLHTTYLDPRGTQGPTIVDSHGVPYNPPDAREGINPNLVLIALLNGFTLAPFVHEYWDENTRGYVRKNKPQPAILDQNQEGIGNTVLGSMATRSLGHIPPENFEYAAYVALKQALEGINSRNPARSNYKIYHKVYVRRTGAAQRDGIFELDVVALLGYQIVVVSCTLETRNARIKEKGFEVIRRARQLGGDEAQAIVLCQGHPNTAQRVERELYDEVGSAGAPLKVWGTDRWANLQNGFSNYLRDTLHWR